MRSVIARAPPWRSESAFSRRRRTRGERRSGLRSTSNAHQRGRAEGDRRLSAQCAAPRTRSPARRAARPSSPRPSGAHEGDRRADDDRVLVRDRAVVVVADRQARTAARAPRPRPRARPRARSARRGGARRRARGGISRGSARPDRTRTRARTARPRPARTSSRRPGRAPRTAGARPPGPWSALVATFASQRPRHAEVDSGIANGGSESPASQPLRPAARSRPS